MEKVLVLSGFCYATGKDAQPGDIISGEAWQIRQWIHSGFVRRMTPEDLDLANQEAVREQLEQAAKAASDEAERLELELVTAADRLKAAETALGEADKVLAGATDEKGKAAAKARVDEAVAEVEKAETLHAAAKIRAADAAKLAKAAGKAVKD